MHVVDAGVTNLYQRQFSGEHIGTVAGMCRPGPEIGASCSISAVEPTEFPIPVVQSAKVKYGYSMAWHGMAGMASTTRHSSLK